MIAGRYKTAEFDHINHEYINLPSMPPDFDRLRILRSAALLLPELVMMVGPGAAASSSAYAELCMDSASLCRRRRFYAALQAAQKALLIEPLHEDVGSGRPGGGRCHATSCSPACRAVPGQGNQAIRCLV
jgi:hypothetical protein